MKILLIADDLTGALDSSVAFSERGLTVLCALSPANLLDAIEQNPDVIAVTTNSREMVVKEASSRIAVTLETVDNHPAWRDAVVFKKVDSRLKGHVAAEVAVLAENRSSVLVCPAIPRLGRLVKNGAVCGAGVAVPIPVADVIDLANAQVSDAQSDADLDKALASVDLSTLFIGAAGLAEALARRIVADPPSGTAPVLSTPALFAIGSRDPTTLAQLDGFTLIAAPNGKVPERQHSDQSLSVVQITPDVEDVDPLQAAAYFADGICKWINRDKPATLLACGGESAAAIARQLGCGLFQVEGEVLPGLPVSTMLDGLMGMKVVTKSGGFGGPDTLVNLVDKLVK